MNDQTEDIVDPVTDGTAPTTEPASMRSLPGLRAMAAPLLGVALVSLGVGFLLARNVGDEFPSAGPNAGPVTAAPATDAPGATTIASGSTTTTTTTTSTSPPTATTTAPGTATTGAGSVASTTPAIAVGSTATTAGPDATAGTGVATTSTTGTGTTVAVAGTTVATTPGVGPTQAPTTRPATTTTAPPQPTTTRPLPTTVPGPPYVAAVTASAPLGYWRLDEPSGGRAADQSGNGHRGVYAGGFLTDQPGALAGGAGRAVLFESGAVEVPDAPALRLNGAFTIELWARLESFQNTRPGLVVKGRASTADGYLVYYDPSGRVILKRNEVEVASAPGALRAGAFTHLAVTYDGSTVRWYVDGAISASKAATYPPNNGGGVLAIGQGEQYGVHTVDEVALYGSALSASTLQAHVDAARR